MRYLPLLASVVVLLAAVHPAAGQRMLSQPPALPLGVLVGQAKTIHALRVSHRVMRALGSSEKKYPCVSFKLTATLKGKADPPFTFLYAGENGGREGLFRPGATVLWLNQGGDGAILFTNDRWTQAIKPDTGRGEKEWYCLDWDMFAPVYEGSTRALQQHIDDIRGEGADHHRSGASAMGGG
jgi:hypothetical protein